MNIEKMIGVYVEYCRSEMLRPKTIEAYKQGLYLFAAWLKENENVTDFEAVQDVMIRRYMLDLQNRGKYTFSADRKQEMINYPTHRRDYNQKLSNMIIWLNMELHVIDCECAERKCIMANCCYGSLAIDCDKELFEEIRSFVQSAEKVFDLNRIVPIPVDKEYEWVIDHWGTGKNVDDECLSDQSYCFIFSRV